MYHTYCVPLYIILITICYIFIAKMKNEKKKKKHDKLWLVEHKKWYRRFVFSRDRLWTTTSFNKITHDNIRVSGAYRESTLGQTWLKLPKISEKFEFDVKLWKVLFCEGFDLIWPLVNPRLTRCILVILAEKCTLGAPVSKRVAPHHSECPRSPMKRK